MLCTDKIWTYHQLLVARGADAEVATSREGHGQPVLVADHALLITCLSLKQRLISTKRSLLHGNIV